ncbi:hypothetical protein EPH95_04145 [Salicibibacter halophilus]|uniref:Uncharacterized protein n=1 Tax=Salicibibacter halophilus TaxID=2502791 RepID=A0A514LF41_9BACI|nr:hypothetical protein [Salicibibacter halophilus]QDI90470.1 hypothetical protein EPH95_04145 [Salicibibacter halophilus]
MDALSKNVKEELANALNDKDSAMFVTDGKLFSLEVHDMPSMEEIPNDLAQEIEEYSELKKSLQRYLDNPDMQRYTAKELRESRYDHRG